MPKKTEYLVEEVNKELKTSIAELNSLLVSKMKEMRIYIQTLHVDM